MKTAKRWIDWPHDECPACGDDVQIETTHSQQLDPDDYIAPGITGPWVYSGDNWRCAAGHAGTIYCDPETPVMLELPYRHKSADARRDGAGA